MAEVFQQRRARCRVQNGSEQAGQQWPIRLESGKEAENHVKCWQVAKERRSHLKCQRPDFDRQPLEEHYGKY